MKFQIEANLEYVVGHLRYGHYITTVEANSEEELRELLTKESVREQIFNTAELIIDNYEVDDIGPIELPLTIIPLDK